MTEIAPTADPVVIDDTAERRFLFLQGLATPFFRRLAKSLEKRGARVLCINFNGGDLALWGGKGINYRDTIAAWPMFLSAFLRREAVTDIVCFGEHRSYHQAAFEVADRLGVATHIFEEGYLRPNWITLERCGTNAGSCIPRDRRAIELMGKTAPAKQEMPSSGSFLFRMRWEFAYQAARILLAPIFPNHHYHRPWHPLVELGGWSRRVVRLAATVGRAKRRISRLWQSERPYFLYPLQLDSDSAIRIHSDYVDNGEAAEEIIASFAAHAPVEAILLVKVHPLDNGLVHREAQIGEIARRHNIDKRVIVIDGGHLPSLLDRANGVVLINSTLGMSAVLHNRPVKVLGRAIYDLPGLTHQGSLDSFWHEATAPEASLAEAFYNAVAKVTQVRGAFFNHDAIENAVAIAARRLIACDPRPIEVTALEPTHKVAPRVFQRDTKREIAVKVLRTAAERRGMRQPV